MDIKHAILAVVNHEPTYGYRVIGLLQALFGDAWTVNSGQIYSTLSRLERDKQIESLPGDEEQTTRTRYAITKKGEDSLRQWYLEPLSISFWARDDIPAKLALSRLSGPVSPQEIIQAQRRKLLQELHQFTVFRDENSIENQPGQYLYLQSAILHLEADLRWLDIVERHLDELHSAPTPTYEPRRPGRPKGSS